MLPVERLPGFDAWGGRLETLRTHPGPVWIWGDPGSGVSSFLQWLGAQRNGPVLDDADGGDAGRLAAFLEGEVRATLGAHRDPEAAVPALAPRLLVFRLPSLEEDPRCLAELAAAIGAAEGLSEALPSALWQLPCPGNVAGLRNRILRWKLLGQLPLPAGAAEPPASAAAAERYRRRRSIGWKRSLAVRLRPAVVTAGLEMAGTILPIYTAKGDSEKPKVPNNYSGNCGERDHTA